MFVGGPAIIFYAVRSSYVRGIYDFGGRFNYGNNG